MAKDGLIATSYSKWLEHPITIDETIKQFIEFFVIRTPSFKLSHRERNLYSYYRCTTPDDYVQLWNSLCLGIEDKCCKEKYGQLKTELLAHKWLCFDDIPTDIEEAIYMVVGKYSEDELYKAFFSSLPAIQSKGKKKEEIETEANRKHSIAYVNTLFRHIRNSFAHGCFALIENDNDTFFIFQDEDRDHRMSARIVVTERRLESWIELLNKQHGVVTEAINETEAV